MRNSRPQARDHSKLMFNSWLTAAHQPLTTARWLIAWGWLQRMAAEDAWWESLLRKVLRMAAEKGCSSKSLLLFKISSFLYSAWARSLSNLMFCSSDIQNCGKTQSLNVAEQPFRHFVEVERLLEEERMFVQQVLWHQGEALAKSGGGEEEDRERSYWSSTHVWPRKRSQKGRRNGRREML